MGSAAGRYARYVSVAKIQYLFAKMFAVAQTEQESDHYADSDGRDQNDDFVRDGIIVEKQALHD